MNINLVRRALEAAAQRIAEYNELQRVYSEMRQGRPADNQVDAEILQKIGIALKELTTTED